MDESSGRSVASGTAFTPRTLGGRLAPHDRDPEFGLACSCIPRRLYRVQLAVVPRIIPVAAAWAGTPALCERRACTLYTLRSCALVDVRKCLARSVSTVLFELTSERCLVLIGNGIASSACIEDAGAGNEAVAEKNRFGDKHVKGNAAIDRISEILG